MDTDFSKLSTERLEKMQAAALEAKECHRVLNKTGANVVSEILKGSDSFYQMTHYPEGDVYDHETHSQYYYHAHRTGEHGHFHLFLRPKGMPGGMKPARVDDYCAPDGENDALSHLIAISMDPFGMAKGLFTTNRWVTAEYWYDCEDVIRMLDHFDIDHAYPSWPANRWIRAIVQLYHPDICDLLRQRDQVIANWKADNPDRNVFEDRELEIPSEIFCSVAEQTDRINQELQRRHQINGAS